MLKEKVFVNRDGCIGCTNCTQVCPQVFEMIDGKSSPNSELSQKFVSDVDMAIQQCPVQVISWDHPLSGLEKKSSQSSFFSFISQFFKKKKEPISSKLALLSKEYYTDDVVLFTFSKDEKNSLPGQFFTFVFDTQEGEIRRSYSVFEETQTSLSFCIHLTPQGKGSDQLRKMKEGESVICEGPFGNFILQNNTKPKVFIATGTGIAPIYRMISCLSPEVNAIVIFGVRSEKDIFLMNSLSLYKNLKTVLLLSAPSENWTGKKGRVTSFLNEDILLEDAEYYLCGNPNMVQDSKKILLEKSINLENIFYEQF